MRLTFTIPPGTTPLGVTCSEGDEMVIVKKTDKDGRCWEAGLRDARGWRICGLPDSEARTMGFELVIETAGATQVSNVVKARGGSETNDRLLKAANEHGRALQVVPTARIEAERVCGCSYTLSPGEGFCTSCGTKVPTHETAIVMHTVEQGARLVIGSPFPDVIFEHFILEDESKEEDNDETEAQPSDSLLPFFDPYSVLGIPHFSSVDDVKRAFKPLSLQSHPDKTSTPVHDFSKLLEAKEQLTCSKQKEDIDERIRKTLATRERERERGRGKQSFATRRHPYVLYKSLDKEEKAPRRRAASVPRY
eukprot:TRINITY_DN24643_c0_g1_i1.p1 TRINITY_DN24643_c0_g1~~TRINITY_DN24643_c0_g1_i1.p1  ORF type:complete len:322 (+),score=74.25 TRINITY_DN24643_c0_g1_i1:46-966(+)